MEVMNLCPSLSHLEIQQEVVEIRVALELGNLMKSRNSLFFEHIFSLIISLE